MGFRRGGNVLRVEQPQGVREEGECEERGPHHVYTGAPLHEKVIWLLLQWPVCNCALLIVV